jgi:hypothetical protein
MADDHNFIMSSSGMNQANIRFQQPPERTIQPSEISGWRWKMNYAEARTEIENSVVVLGFAYAASLISLIVWVA